MAAPEQDAAELDQLERLVDIQRQIVALSEQNAAIERDCLALREALVEEFEARQQRPPVVRRWLAAFRQRWSGRAARPETGPEPERIPLRLHSHSA